MQMKDSLIVFIAFAFFSSSVTIQDGIFSISPPAKIRPQSLEPFLIATRPSSAITLRQLRLKGGCEEKEYDSKDGEKFDGVLWDILKSHPDEIYFLNTIFNFLQRRTPCFNGPKAEDNFQVIIDTLSHQKKVYLDHLGKGIKPRPPKPMPERSNVTSTKKKSAPISAPVPARPPPPAAASDTPATPPVPAGLMPRREAALAQPSTTTPSALSTNRPIPPRNGTKQHIRQESPKKKVGLSSIQTDAKIPVDNGGITDRYRWSQTLRDVTMEIWLPAKATAKQLEVNISLEHLRVTMRPPAGAPAGPATVVLEGQLLETVVPSESFWTVDGDVLVVTLMKQAEMSWWKTAIRGDPEIDVQKVDAETSNLNDLTPDLRQTVEKMMYDQKQKALGLPTSDERKNKDKLKQFMAMHPEMDFSQCKFG